MPRQDFTPTATCGGSHARLGPRRLRRAFTLVEILIVVVIIGILAALTVPKFADASTDAGRVTFMNNLRAFVDAAYRFEFTSGAPLPDSNTGELPAGFETYIREVEWQRITPIGGQWDVERVTVGGETRAAVGVHFDGTGETRGDAFMLEIDAVMDDGDLATGAFRRIGANRYYWTIG